MKNTGCSKTKNINLHPFKSVLQDYKQSLFIVNFIAITLIMFFTLSCGKVEEPVQPARHQNGTGPVTEEEPIEENVATELEVESKTKFKMHMEDLGNYYDDLEVAIEIQDWEKIQVYAMQMKNTSPVVLTGQRKEKLPHGFVILDTKYHLHTLKLVEAAEAREMVQLNIEYEKVKQTCNDCHEKYKKKEG